MAVALLISCAHGRIVDPIECPAPSLGVADELQDMLLGGDGVKYDDLLIWIGEIERHCSAVASSVSD